MIRFRKEIQFIEKSSPLGAEGFYGCIVTEVPTGI